MIDALVIGVGNRHRGDDAFGCLVAAELGERLPAGSRAIEHDGEPAGLMEAWKGARQVVLVDAVASGGAPGTVFRFDLAIGALPAALDGACSTHVLGLSQAVELARALGRLPPRISLVGVEGACFDAGDGLSPAVRQAKDAVVAEVLTLLDGTTSPNA